jgi:drug/metabolite transporter (DMT)-like permease
VSEGRGGWLPYLAVAALALIWGASFMFIKVAVQDVSPPVLVLIRSVAGLLALALIMVAMGRGIVPSDWRRRLVPYAIMAITGGVFPWIAIAWGEERISSGLASILNATTPLWAAIFVYWVIPAERPRPVTYAGVLIGLAGVVLLVLPDLAEGARADVIGFVAVLLASASYAVSALYQRRKLRGMNVYEASLGQLALTVILIAPLAAPTAPSAHFHLISFAAALALGIAGSGIAGVLYYYVLNSLGPVRGSGATLLVPLTAVFWGFVLLHEVVTVPMLVGMVVILVGIVLTNLGRRAASPERSEPEKAAA